MIPDVLRQMIAEQEDMEVVGDCRGPMKILQETGKVNADIVILAQDGSEELGLCSQLLATYPDLTIVSVLPELDMAFTQQLCSHRKQVLSGNRLGIVQAMRKAVRQPCTGRSSWVE
jgi:DNA-binding NarL/FixJ family response regulator